MVIESQSKLKPLRVKVFPVSYAKVEDLEVQAKDFVSERGRVKADKRTNALIATDVDENLEKISKLIAQLDTQTPQVLIEAKIIEAQQSFQRRIGVNWNFGGSPIELGNNTLGAPVNLQANAAAGVPPENATTPVFGTLGMTVGSLDLLGDLQSSLSLFEKEGDIKVVSSPRIVTMNGVKATIVQTQQLPIPKVTVIGTGSLPQTTYDFKDMELRLECSPQITADGGIIMQVKVIREFAGEFLAGGAASKNSRSAETTILIGNGQTVVMGGIYQSDMVNDETGVPFLRKIPIIGSLFKDNTKRDTKNELMIFLTPRILNKERAFKAAKSSLSQ
jgi:type IV pilus assembly protein PilQ